MRHFLDTTQSQLTYHGLFHLASSLPPNVPCALFRSSHLSVLYKHSPGALNHTPTSGSSNAVAGGSSSSSAAVNDTAHDEDSVLYTLVTDQVFLTEPSVVWERLEDVDGGSSSFVDSEFMRSSPAGGDYAGQTAEEALRVAEEADRAFQGVVDPNEYVYFMFFYLCFSCD